jgi:3-hydroxyisobutyrate dehydrogenase
MARIGIPGVGRMGSAIAERLLDMGHEVIVWNRSPGKAQLLLERGAVLAESPRALAAQAETILTILTDGTAMKEVYEDADGVLSADVKDKLIVEMSTVRPDVQVALAAKVRSHMAAYVECPVGGTVGPARQGKLLGLAGGEADDVERARAVLDQICRRVDHVGPVGAGASLKLSSNLLLLVFFQTFGEALTLCRHLNLDPRWLTEFFADVSGGTNLLKTRGPAIALALQGGDPQPRTYDLDLVRKDLRMMLEEARALGSDLPVTARALEVYDGAAAAGWGDRDSAALPGYWPSRSAKG